MMRAHRLSPFSAAQGQPAPSSVPWVSVETPAERGGENPFAFPLSDRGDRLHAAFWIVACVALGLAFNAVGIVLTMSAASDLPFLSDTIRN